MEQPRADDDDPSPEAVGDASPPTPEPDPAVPEPDPAPTSSPEAAPSPEAPSSPVASGWAPLAAPAPAPSAWAVPPAPGAPMPALAPLPVEATLRTAMDDIGWGFWWLLAIGAAGFAPIWAAVLLLGDNPLSTIVQFLAIVPSAALLAGAGAVRAGRRPRFGDIVPPGAGSSAALLPGQPPGRRHRLPGHARAGHHRRRRWRGRQHRHGIGPRPDGRDHPADDRDRTPAGRLHRGPAVAHRAARRGRRHGRRRGHHRGLATHAAAGAARARGLRRRRHPGHPGRPWRDHAGLRAADPARRIGARLRARLRGRHGGRDLRQRGHLAAPRRHPRSATRGRHGEPCRRRPVASRCPGTPRERTAGR